ncbi:MAG: hypothetical protein K6A65_08500 [Succinivibrionaceae bacterium]|nr:hypothetical protein [Succinivibrionaceae bacterium]
MGKDGGGSVQHEIEALIILDHGAAMAGLEDLVVGQCNRLLARLRRGDTNARVTVVHCGPEVRITHQREAALLIPDLGREGYAVGGGSALLDAIGTGLALVGGNPGPAQVLVAIFTAGHDDCSRAWGRGAIRDLVARRSALGQRIMIFGSCPAMVWGREANGAVASYKARLGQGAKANHALAPGKGARKRRAPRTGMDRCLSVRLMGSGGRRLEECFENSLVSEWQPLPQRQ